MARGRAPAYGGRQMRSRRTQCLLGSTAAAIASGLLLAPGAGASTGEKFVHFPRTASINSSSGVPVAVDPANFKALTTAVASSWGIPIDGDTLASPGDRDGVNSIGFSARLPENVLGAYVYWPRRLYKLQKHCVRRSDGRRICKRVKRYIRTEIAEADVAFSNAFAWNEGPAYPALDEIDLPTVEFHELGHFHDPNTPHGRRCSGSPLTESLGYGEWWRGPHDWFEQSCTNVSTSRQRVSAAAAQPIFTRVVHPLPDRVIATP
jgi:hypothetical protein